MKPQMQSGSQYEFLQYQVRGRVLQASTLPNQTWRDIIINLFYGPSTGCDAEPNSAGQKNSLATATAAEVLAAGQNPIVVPNLGTVSPKGFLLTFMTPLLNALSIGWVNNGVYGRWFDTPTDPFEPVGVTGNPGVSPVGLGTALTVTTTVVAGVVTAAVVVVGGTLYSVGDLVYVTTTSPGVVLQVATVTAGGVAATLTVLNGGAGAVAAVASATTSYSYSFPAGDGAVTGDRLPLDNNATIRRYTAVRGKNWGGNIRPAPIAESQTTADQFTAGAQVLWKLVANAMYTPISDGESLLYPLLVSATESQLIRNPTRVAYAPLVLPGINPVTGAVNAVVDLALGESKRRKEKKSVTF